MDRGRISAAQTIRPSAIRRRAVLIGGGAAAALLLPRGSGDWQALAQQHNSNSNALNEPFLVMRRYRLAPEATLAEVVRRTEEEFVPILRQIPGFVAYYSIDLGNGEGATISLFSSQAGAEESTARAAAWVQENLADLVAGPPEVMQGIVLLNVMTEEASSGAQTS